MGGFLQSLDNFFNAGTGFLFGPIMLCVFFGTGILMTIVTRGVQFRKFGVAIRTEGEGADAEDKAQFDEFMTSVETQTLIDTISK